MIFSALDKHSSNLTSYDRYADGTALVFPDIVSLNMHLLSDLGKQYKLENIYQNTRAPL